MKVIMVFTHIITALVAFIVGSVSGAFCIAYFYRQLKDILDSPRYRRPFSYSSYYRRVGDDE